MFFSLLLFASRIGWIQHNDVFTQPRVFALLRRRGVGEEFLQIPRGGNENENLLRPAGIIPVIAPRLAE